MIAFIGGRSGHGYHIFTIADDGSCIRCLTEAFPLREAVFFHPIWSPDGMSLAFTLKDRPLSQYSQICTIWIDSGEVHYLTPPESNDFALQWLSNGALVYAQEIIRPAEADSYLCTMNGDGSQQQRVFHYSRYRGADYEPDSYRGVVVSPDGSKLAMVSWHDHQLYIRHEGLTPALIENEGLQIQRAAWAPDNSTLAFTAIRAQPRKYEVLYVTHDDGTGKKQVGRVLAESGYTWSPDSQRITTVNVQKDEFTFNTIDVQTLESQTITTFEVDPESGNAPGCHQWSPDGRYICYTTFADPYTHIYRIEVATRQIELLVGDEGAFHSISSLSWHE
jgi:Tol biopolymer transport system component